jgi:hypothetical protein
MPELPEVETIARNICPALVGKTILSVKLLWDRTLAVPSPLAFKRRIKGQRIEAVGRRAKFLCLSLSNDVLLIHLRMSGDLLAVLGDEASDRSQLLIVFPEPFLIGLDLRFDPFDLLVDRVISPATNFLVAQPVEASHPAGRSPPARPGCPAEICRFLFGPNADRLCIYSQLPAVSASDPGAWNNRPANRRMQSGARQGDPATVMVCGHQVQTKALRHIEPSCRFRLRVGIVFVHSCMAPVFRPGNDPHHPRPWCVSGRRPSGATAC